MEHVGIGTTADVFVVEKENELYGLKVQRGGSPGGDALRTEHGVLQYLSTTAMRQHVPRVEEWLPELDGLLMEYLRYPTRAEKEARFWIPNLARALQVLHSIGTPSIKEIPDERPEVGAAISNRLHDLFEVVLKEDAFWTGLPREDKSNLERVRAHHKTYAGLLPQIGDTLSHGRSALTHGDLAGDNIMLGRDGRLVLADWSAARISSPLTDIADLLTHGSWPEAEEQEFLSLYFRDTPQSSEEAQLCVGILTRLYRYRSCVQSLLWLNEMGTDGLDAVGRAHFEMMLGVL